MTRSGRTESSGALDGRGESPWRSRRYAASQPARLAPTTSASQSSPTWRIALPGLPRAAAATAKISGDGLIAPTRCDTTIAWK